MSRVLVKYQAIFLDFFRGRLEENHIITIMDTYGKKQGKMIY